MALRKAYKETKAAEVDRKASKIEYALITGLASFAAFLLYSFGVTEATLMELLGGAGVFILSYLGIKEGIDIGAAIKKGVELGKEKENGKDD